MALRWAADLGASEGRLWFFAFFVIGALGGSLMSLAVGPQNLVSVGASGAPMGLFAALFIGGFLVPAGTAIRTRLQVNSTVDLHPVAAADLLIVFWPGNIDYGVHFGGAIAGSTVAALLLKFWPKTARIPQVSDSRRRHCHRGGLLFVVSAGPAVVNYPKYDIVIIPRAEFPGSIAGSPGARGNLAARYPQDPRAYPISAKPWRRPKMTWAQSARRRASASTQAQTYEAIFRAQFKDVMAAVLGAFSWQSTRGGTKSWSWRAQYFVTPGDKGVENLQKLLTDRHLCDAEQSRRALSCGHFISTAYRRRRSPGP